MTSVRSRRGTFGRKFGIVIAAAGLVLAACGSDDDEPEDSTATTEATDDSAPAETAAEVPCDTGPATLDPVKIGVAWVEGPAVALPELGEAANAAVDYANDCLGGIGGHEIEVIPCMIDETNPASATECANTVIEEGAVAMVITITSQGQTLVPAVTAAGIPYITSTGVSPAESLDTTGKVFTLTGGVAASMGAMAIEAQEIGVQKVAILVPENAAGPVGGLAGIPFGNAGVEFEVISVPPGTPDLTPQVSAAVADGADALTMFGEQTFCIAFLNATYTVAPDANRWITGTCASSDVTDQVGEEVFDGTTLFGGADPEADDPELNEFRAVMAQYAPDTSTEGFAPAAYTAVIGMIRGLADIGEDVSADTITSTMAATVDVALPTGFGLTYSCSEQPLPPLTVCSGLTVVSDMDGSTPVDPRLVDASEVFSS